MSDAASLNAKAQESFNKLRTKMKLDLQTPLIKEGIKINESKIQELFDAPKDTLVSIKYLKDNPALDKAIEEIKFVDNSFYFIESLNLPSQLSLAIGLIIAGNKTKDRFELIKAIEILQQFDHEKAWKE